MRRNFCILEIIHTFALEIKKKHMRLVNTYWWWRLQSIACEPLCRMH